MDGAGMIPERERAAMDETGTAPGTQPGKTAPSRAVPGTASVSAAVNAEPVAPTPSTGPSPATQTFASMLAAAGYDRYSSIKNQIGRASCRERVCQYV